MLLSSVRVKNYRSLLDVTVPCSQLTAFVGANGMGKSTVLRAANLFYAGSPQLAKEDWFNKDTGPNIEITLTFSDLNADAASKFSSYMQGDELSVTRIFVMGAAEKVSDTYHGATLRHPAFAGLWNLPGGPMKEGYNNLRQSEPYKTDLPAYSNLETARSALRTWEGSHPEACAMAADDGQFFGFKSVAQGYLGDFTCMIFVPAVRDLSDEATEGKGSAITALIDIVARNVLAAQADFRNLEAEMQEKYGNLLAPSQAADLAGLARELSGTLQTIAPDAGVHLKWLPPPPVQFPMPKVEVQLSEDGQPFSVAGTGHGLQRAFIVTLLQHLAKAQRRRAEIEAKNPTEAKVSIPNIVLAIEEPELYQHPTRQRHLARLFLNLSQGRAIGLADTTQIMYATHCPLFVGLDRFDQVRIVTKDSSGEGLPKDTRVAYKTLDGIALTLETIEKRAAGTFNGAALQARLTTVFTPWLSEGFFADVIVLVEGQSDRAALMGAADNLGHDFDHLGIAVLPCESKSKLFSAAAIFLAFGIPTYCLWDGDARKGPTQGKCPVCQKDLDKKADPIENQRIMRLLGKKDEQWPNFIADDAACFENCLEHTLHQELGADLYNRLLGEVAHELGYSKIDHAKKNPSVVAELLKRAMVEGKNAVSLKTIVLNIHKMRRPSMSMEADPKVSGNAAEQLVAEDIPAWGEPNIAVTRGNL